MFNTSEVEDICFVLERALGLLHDETQPGAQQHSKILPLVSPPPPLPPANQEPADPEETLQEPSQSILLQPSRFRPRLMLHSHLSKFTFWTSCNRIIKSWHSMSQVLYNFGSYWNTCKVLKSMILLQINILHLMLDDRFLFGDYGSNSRDSDCTPRL